MIIFAAMSHIKKAKQEKTQTSERRLMLERKGNPDVPMKEQYGSGLFNDSR